MKHEEFKLFVDQIDQYVYDQTNDCKDNSDFSKYELAVISLELLIMNKLNKECRSYITGLHEIGLAKESDIVDLHVIIGDNYFEKSDVERDSGIILMLSEIMDHSRDWKILKTFQNEAAIKCICHLTNQKFLVTIGNGLKIEQYSILRHLFSIQPEASTFFHFIRHWIMDKSSCCIDLKHLLLLVVHYFQEYNFMPTLFHVFMDLPKITIDGCHVQFDESRNLHSYNLNRMDYYRKHVLNFFRFYRFFDFPYNIISIYRGYQIPSKRYWRDFRNMSAINILFMEHENNFSPNVKFHQVFDFTNICKVSYHLFKDF